MHKGQGDVGGPPCQDDRGWFEKLKENQYTQCIVTWKGYELWCSCRREICAWVPRTHCYWGVHTPARFELWYDRFNRTYITAKEKSLPCHKPMTDRLSFLLCTNASGDYNIKLSLVYHSGNPEVFKRCKDQRKKINMMLRALTKPGSHCNILLNGSVRYSSLFITVCYKNYIFCLK